MVVEEESDDSEEGPVVSSDINGFFESTLLMFSDSMSGCPACGPLGIIVILRT